MLEMDGVIEIDTRLSVTLTVSDPLIAPRVAVIFACPPATVVSRPVLLMDATLLAD